MCFLYGKQIYYVVEHRVATWPKKVSVFPPARIKSAQISYGKLVRSPIRPLGGICAHCDSILLHFSVYVCGKPQQKMGQWQHACWQIDPQAELLWYIRTNNALG